MKVILKDTNEVKKVSFGYAVNFLIPQGLALVATPENIRLVEEKKKLIFKKNKEEEKKVEGLAKSLLGKKIVIKAKVGKGKKIFGSVTKKEILSKLSVSSDKVEVLLDKPIKKLGTHQVDLKINGRRIIIEVKVIKE